MTTRLASLDAIAAEIWRELESAVHDRADPPHGWRTPVLATTDGESGDARTVVVREVDAATRTLRIYTDERSPKVAQLRSHPLATLVLWSPQLAWQLRCRVRLSLEDDGLAVSSRWAHIKLSPAAQDYLSPIPPGAPLEGQGAVPTHEAVARSNFAVIVAQVLAIDWLELHPDGHRRAMFDGAFDGASARWLQP